MTLSEQLVARLGSLPSTTIPPDVRNAAKLHLLDAIGVGLAAAATGAGAPYLAAAPALNGSGGPASISAPVTGLRRRPPRSPTAA